MIDSFDKVIALEGPCLAGKTTLARGLQAELQPLSVAYIPDYAEHVGGGRFLPPPIPDSLDAEERALQEFLRIEAERIARVATVPTDLLLIDRSVHTLLAHCAALEQLTGEPYAKLADTILSQSPAVVWPGTVLYLDLPDDVAQSRNNGKFPVGSVYTTADFNAGFRSYFERLAVEDSLTRVVWLDARLEPEQLREAALGIARECACEAHQGRQR